jgi:branched-chain amino acid transport system substrate-binding protein
MNKIGIVAALLLAFMAAAKAEDKPAPIRIGVLNDQSGPYADVTGKGSVLAAKMAIDDFGGSVLGRPIELLAADHQNKPDIGASIARKWYYEGVDAIFDVPNSGVALAVLEVAREMKKIVVFSGAASPDITGKLCAPTSFHWAYDSYALASGTARAMVEQGGNTWFFITLASTAGYAIQKDATQVITKAGGRVLGSVAHPLNSADFSSFILQARQSGAKVIGLANAGNDTVTSIRQSAEYDVAGAGQKLAGMLIMINDVKALGLQAAHGVFATESFYWDANDATRAWSKRFMGANGGTPANMIQAGVYSGVLHYLKALARVGSQDSIAVANAMRQIPVEDFYTKSALVRADGRVMRDMYLLEAKQPSESKGPWDLYKLVATIPAERAFRPLSEGGCPLTN